jgi:dihydrofolate reductase
MPQLRFEGYVIVSADGMLADASGVMPDSLKYDGDLRFFSSALDRVDLIVHGRLSYEDQPRSPRRHRIILTRQICALARDPVNPRATLWNPAGASFDDALAFAGVVTGTVAIIGGPDVFAMFMDRYDVFWLSEAPRVRLPDGRPCFPGIPERSAQQILAAHGLKPGPAEILDGSAEVFVRPWRRE